MKIVTLVLGLLISPFAFATTIFMDDFGTGGNSGGLTSISNWSVTGNVDLWNFTTFTGYDGYSVDLDGTSSSASISTVNIL